MFSVVHNIDTSANHLNHDLEKISEWNFLWKIKFNPDATKQTQKIIFNNEKAVSVHPMVYFNNTPLNTTATKHLGIKLDSKISYENHLKSGFGKSKQDHFSFEKTSSFSS